MQQKRSIRNILIKNKYAKWYFELVNKRLANPNTIKPIEKHHIIPLSLGGENIKSNLVYFTPREHYIAHAFLCKMTKGKDKRNMSFALSFFNTKCKNHSRYKPKSKLYEMSRRLLSEAMKGIIPSEKCRLAVSKAKKGVPLSNEQKLKLSTALKVIKPVLYIDNENKIHIFNDFRNQSFLPIHTIYNKIKISKRLNDFTIITFGPWKGCIFHHDINIKIDINKINAFRTAALEKSHKNRSMAIAKTHTRDRKELMSKILSKEIKLKDPDGNIHSFNNYKELKKKFPERAISTIQTKKKKNKPIISGPWKDWVKL